MFKRVLLFGAILSMIGFAAPAPRAAIDDVWPVPFPPIGSGSVRAELTRGIRSRLRALGLNDRKGLDGESVSRAVVLLPEDRARAGVIAFEIEAGPSRGIHECEALGRGATGTAPRPGWKTGVVREPGGRSTRVYYAPEEEPDGASVPGVYELRNIRPRDYKVALADPKNEEALSARLADPHADDKPRYSRVWAHFYPQNSRYSDVLPVDMRWSQRDQPDSQGAGIPVFQRPNVRLDPEQAKRDPRYYLGPYGRSGFAIHTDRWTDRETALDPSKASRPELRSFLFRDTNGCIKVEPDCLEMLNRFIDEQQAKGRIVQADVREIQESPAAHGRR